MSQIEISGNDNNELQLQNNPLISVIFDVIHFEISGISFNDEHPLNILFRELTFEISHFEISAVDNKFSQPN